MAKKTVEVEEQRAADQDAAIEQAFVAGTLPEVDRREAGAPEAEPVRAPGDVDRLTPEQDLDTNTKPMESPRGGVPITETPPRWYPWEVAGQATEYEYRDTGGTREFRVKPTGIAAAHTRVPNAETGKMEYFDEAGEPIPLE